MPVDRTNSSVTTRPISDESSGKRPTRSAVRLFTVGEPRKTTRPGGRSRARSK
jgi:hypothetical protein